eukprot:182780_1
MFEQRKVELITLTLIGCIIELIFVVSNLTKSFFSYGIRNGGNLFTYNSVHLLTGILGWILIISGFLSRIFLLLYEHKHNELMSNKFWIILLNENSFVKSFWVRNINRFGNQRWLLKFVGIIVISYAIFTFVVTKLLNRYYRNILIKYHIRPAPTLMLIFIIVSIVIAFTIWINLPSKNDAYGIRQELKYTLISLSFPIICAALTLFILPTYIPGPQRIVSIIVTCFNAIGCFIFGCFPTLWVARTFMIQQLNSQANDQNDCIQLRDMQKLAFTKAMKELEMYEEFMQYLKEHFAVTRLLFLTEYAQFKTSLFMNHSEINEKLPFQMELPTTLPLSNFVINDNETENAVDVFMEKIIALFQKYLAPKAKHPLNNFNYVIRDEISNMIDEHVKSKCICISKTEALKQYEKLLQQFEKAAFYVAWQLNRTFSNFKHSRSRSSKHKSRRRTKRRSRSLPTIIQVKYDTK